jgi:putative transposase
VGGNLLMPDRARVGREASPTAAVICSQSAKTTERGGVRVYDAGEKIKSRKRHAKVETNGRGVTLQAHSTGIQDSNDAGRLLRPSVRGGC